jgi:hypothetical protein
LTSDVLVLVAFIVIGMTPAGNQHHRHFATKLFELKFTVKVCGISREIKLS